MEFVRTMMQTEDQIRITEDILRLKKQKGVHIFAHCYQSAAVRKAADHVLETLEMAFAVSQVEGDTVIVCAARSVGETVKILNPHKRVLIPRPEAECALSAQMLPRHIRAMRSAYPDAAVVCFINSSAAVKAQSDVCCTASSAVRIVRSLKAGRVIFAPDRNLAKYMADRVPEKEIIAFSGYCPVHEKADETDVSAARAKYPGAKLLVSPQCADEVVKSADFAGGTDELMAFAGNSLGEKFVLGAEASIPEILAENEAEKSFYPLSDAMTCPSMKLIALDDVLNCILNDEYEVQIEPEELTLARRAMGRMLKVLLM